MNDRRAIDEIIVGKRHRRDLGDITSLAKSIDAHGLLHPVVVTPDGRLIAGERRLEAFKMLGRTEIPAREVDLEEIARGELAENVDRKGFLPSEIEAIRRTLEPLEKAAARERQGRPGGPRSGKLPEHSGARTRDKLGAFAGVSGRTVEKIAAVVAAAEAEPKKYGKLAEAMDHRGRVDGPYRRLLNMRSAEQIRASPPPLPDGQWRVAVVDVPWPSEPDDPEPAERGYWTFATMSIEAICAVPIGSRLHDHSVLWFWVTNFHMRYAYTILDAWGFRATPTIQTWGKPQPGRGKRLLGQTEHAIMAIRGNPVITLTNQSTLLLAPIPKPRTLARKPPEFYAMVETLCPAPGYLDVFSRYRHSDRWTCWGAEAPLHERGCA
jgi:N6-adenosine-specific RNA methylase IME4